MTVYVAEIAGRGVVAFEAADESAATARLADKAFQRDLIVFQNEGRPLWDGVSEIRLRDTLPKEAAAWQAGRAAPGEPDEPDGQESRRVFLIPVVNPLQFGDDDDDDDDGDDYDHGD